MFIANLCAYAKTALPDDDDAEIADAPDGIRRALELVGVVPKEKLATVDVMSKLKAAGVDHVYPVVMWPDTDATRQLATWVKNKKKHHGSKAYVYVNFKRNR